MPRLSAVARRPLAAVRAALASRGLSGTIVVTDFPGVGGGVDKRRFEFVGGNGITRRTITIAADAETWELAMLVRELPLGVRADKLSVLDDLSSGAATDLDEPRPGHAAPG